MKNSYSAYILIIYYIPSVLIIIANLYIYCKVLRVVKSHMEYIEKNPVGHLVIQRLYLYPIIGILCLLPMAIYRLLTIISDNNGIFLEFRIFSVMLMCINGFFNSIIYGFNPSIKRKISKCICPCLRSINNSSQISIGLTDSFNSITLS